MRYLLALATVLVTVGLANAQIAVSPQGGYYYLGGQGTAWVNQNSAPVYPHWSAPVGVAVCNGESCEIYTGYDGPPPRPRYGPPPGYAPPGFLPPPQYPPEDYRLAQQRPVYSREFGGYGYWTPCRPSSNGGYR